MFLSGHHWLDCLYRPAQENGIWAWDCELSEPVLVIPWVLALLGDNPMQSEFACHIGLRGKYFCRACWVKGSDALDGVGVQAKPTTAATADSGTDANNSSIESDESHSGNTETSTSPDAPVAKGKGRKKFKETLQQAMNRVTAFLKVCPFSDDIFILITNI